MKARILQGFFRSHYARICPFWWCPKINFLPNYLFCGIYLSLPSPQPLSHRERGFFGLKHWHRFPAKSWFGKRPIDAGFSQNRRLERGSTQKERQPLAWLPGFWRIPSCEGALLLCELFFFASGANRSQKLRCIVVLSVATIEVLAVITLEGVGFATGRTKDTTPVSRFVS